MTEEDDVDAEFVAQHRELARREFIARVSLRPVLRCDMVTLRDAEGEYLCPKVGSILNPLGIAWGQNAQEKDGSVYVHLYREIPAELSKLAGIAVERPTLEKYDELLPPYADRVAGHFSRAHTSVFYAYPFTSDYNPLSVDSAHWTKKAGGTNDCKSSSGALDYIGATTTQVEYINASIGTMAAADYSVGMDLVKPNQNSASSVWCPTLRYNFTTSAQDWVRVQYAGNTSGNDFSVRRKTGGAVSVELGAVNVAGNNTAIMQAVGTQFEAFWGGTSQIDVADAGAPTSAYKTGFAAYNINNASQTGFGDNFTVYVAATGNPWYARQTMSRRNK